MKMKNLKLNIISDIIANNDNSNAIIEAFGFDKDGNHVATSYCCNKSNCNCVGSWIVGATDEVALTIKADVFV